MWRWSVSPVGGGVGQQDVTLALLFLDTGILFASFSLCACVVVQICGGWLIALKCYSIAVLCWTSNDFTGRRAVCGILC